MLSCESPRGIRQWANIYRLYLQAFPALERKPFSIILKMYRSGKTHVWYFRQKGKFAGFITTINGESHILLDYLAVSPRLRGQGIGSEILHQMQRRYAGKGVFLEIESAFEEAENKEERLRRRRFYEHCGMKSMEVFAWVFGVKMELMGFDCDLTFEEYSAFYRKHYGKWAAGHLKPAEKQEGL